MKITFILIIIYLLSVYAINEKYSFTNEKYTKYKLRNLAIKGRNKLIKYLIDTEYENIYNTVLQEATLDKKNLTFTILCVDHNNLNNEIFKSIFGNPGVIEKSRYKMFKSESNDYINEIGNDELFSLAQIYKITNDPGNYYKISNDFITSKIIDKLKITFPESNIFFNKEQPQINPNFNTNPIQCTYYTLDW
jgi:hypothetical protein